MTFKLPWLIGVPAITNHCEIQQAVSIAIRNPGLFPTLLRGGEIWNLDNEETNIEKEF